MCVRVCVHISLLDVCVVFPLRFSCFISFLLFTGRYVTELTLHVTNLQGKGAGRTFVMFLYSCSGSSNSKIIAQREDSSAASYVVTSDAACGWVKTTFVGAPGISSFTNTYGLPLSNT